MGHYVSDTKHNSRLMFQKQHREYFRRRYPGRHSSALRTPPALHARLNLIAAADLPLACHSPPMIHHPAIVSHIASSIPRPTRAEPMGGMIETNPAPSTGRAKQAATSRTDVVQLVLNSLADDSVANVRDQRRSIRTELSPLLGRIAPL